MAIVLLYFFGAFCWFVMAYDPSAHAPWITTAAFILCGLDLVLAALKKWAQEKTVSNHQSGPSR